jgi:hypothetical protein
MMFDLIDPVAMIFVLTAACCLIMGVAYGQSDQSLHGTHQRRSSLYP